MGTSGAPLPERAFRRHIQHAGRAASRGDMREMGSASCIADSALHAGAVRRQSGVDSGAGTVGQAEGEMKGRENKGEIAVSVKWTRMVRASLFLLTREMGCAVSRRSSARRRGRTSGCGLCWASCWDCCVRAWLSFLFFLELFLLFICTSFPFADSLLDLRLIHRLPSCISSFTTSSPPTLRSPVSFPLSHLSFSITPSHIASFYPQSDPFRSSHYPPPFIPPHLP
ncbi:hypothetical protein B0H11DRAFT_279720 [Mycena galericulata]|nr:hypothetical protein B0H11DRAFT_279720 [Mycena galericulata]